MQGGPWRRLSFQTAARVNRAICELHQINQFIDWTAQQLFGLTGDRYIQRWTVKRILLCCWGRIFVSAFGIATQQHKSITVLCMVLWLFQICIRTYWFLILNTHKSNTKFNNTIQTKTKIWPTNLHVRTASKFLLRISRCPHLPRPSGPQRNCCWHPTSLEHIATLDQARIWKKKRKASYFYDPV